jgi:hypothetical protein
MSIEKCNFCHQIPSAAPLPEMKAHGIDIYFCFTCQTEYSYWSKSGNLNSYSMYHTIDEKMYRWTVLPSGNCQLWHVQAPGIPGSRVNKNLKLIIKFNKKDSELPISNITPSNIDEKIRLYLVML